VSYVNDLVDGAITPKPHWVTELQGGNTFTAVASHGTDRGRYCAVALDQRRSGAERTIFWLLNADARDRGWRVDLLDFEQQPSRRMEVATDIVRTMEAHADFFANAKPALPDVTLLLSLRR